MTSVWWDPGQYLRFGGERTRAFADLLARVPVAARTVADLGCGPGNDAPLSGPAGPRPRSTASTRARR
ncbi:hypothetical protein [Tsukamurella sp. PLM1]|uniref:hypothetical protein n=1 Tax=Tsukamurella sp. PLM1 TaxID=2929795 RepID=UPI0020C1873F|nr:hypothetical protein [Tsukamurella sp. PLM1]